MYFNAEGTTIVDHTIFGQLNRCDLCTRQRALHPLYYQTTIAL